MLKPGSDTELVPEREELLSDGLSVLGASGAIHDVLGSDGIDIYSFYDARGEPHGNKLQKDRALGRKLLAEFLTEEEAAAPRQRFHLRVFELWSSLVDSEEIVDTEKGRKRRRRTAFSSRYNWGVSTARPRGPRAQLDPTSVSLLELVHSDAVDFCTSSSFPVATLATLPLPLLHGVRVLEATM